MPRAWVAAQAQPDPSGRAMLGLGHWAQAVWPSIARGVVKSGPWAAGGGLWGSSADLSYSKIK